MCYARLNKSTGSFYVYSVPKERIDEIRDATAQEFTAVWLNYYEDGH